MTAEEESRAKRNRARVGIGVEFSDYTVMKVKPLSVSRILANQRDQRRLACSIGDDPTGGRVRPL
jgi:hypothetical protein